MTMEGTQMETKRVKRVFTPEQKFEILQDIARSESVKVGLERHKIQYSMYSKWKRQLEVGVNASLRNTKAIKAPDLRRLEGENRRLKELVLNQSLVIGELKKEMNLD
jgi:transposase-like protein